MPEAWTEITLQDTDLELVILPGIGGRLWDVRYHGRSLLFQNPDLIGKTVDLSNLTGLPTRSPQFSFPLWGGEKTWIAPDTLWPENGPYPLLDSGRFQILSHSSQHVEMESQVCPISELSIRRRIALEGPDSWTIEHALTNHGAISRRAGIWSVMMFDTPASVAIPMETPQADTIFGDATGCMKEVQHGIVARCDRPQEFKLGLPNPDGATFIRCGEDGPTVMCNVPVPSLRDAYAHNHPFEIFNSGDYPYCEAEWHSPAQDILPTESLAFRQAFRIWSGTPAPQALSINSSSKELLSCMS